MLARQFLTLALSALIGVFPINFEFNEYPLTRNDTMFIRLSYEVYDLGTTTAAGNTHNYDVKYDVDIYCSSACSLTSVSSNNGFLQSHVTYTFSKRIMNITSESLALRFSGMSTAQYFNRVGTYGTFNTVVGHQISITYDNGQTQDITVYFCAEPIQATLYETNYLIDEFSNLYFLKNFLMDKDVPSSDIQNVTNYLNNGDYSSAVSYVYNYYTTNAVTQNQGNETVVNNYNSHETNLQNISNQEHQFTLGIEDQFENQIQLIDPTNSVIDDVSWQQSAVWVTDKFNRFTNGNAFGSLLGFSLLIGLAMAIIGRVLK